MDRIVLPDQHFVDGVEIETDIVARGVPQAIAKRGFEPPGNGPGGGRILAQQKIAHACVAEIGRVHEIER